MTETETQHFGFSGKKMRAARRARKLSQTELAALLKVHRSSIARWESNLNEPPKEVLLHMAKVVEKEPGWFFEWGKPQPAPVEMEIAPLTEQPPELLQALTPHALREAMKKNRDSLFSLARRLGIDIPTMRGWLSGSIRPSLTQVENIRSVLGENFDPSPVAYRKLSAPPPAPLAAVVELTVEEKLDLILARLGRIEALLGR